MFGVIEIIAATLIVAAIFFNAAARKWLSEIGPWNQRIMIALIGVMIFSQSIDESRKLFPFVRWGMYTDIYNDEKVLIGRFQAVHADGQFSWVNPTQHYPSLARNNHDRVQHFMSKLNDGELSPYVTGLFEEYMLALGKRHTQGYPDNPVVEVYAVLQSIQSSNHQVHTTNRIVRAVKMSDQFPDDIASMVP